MKEKMAPTTEESKPEAMVTDPAGGPANPKAKKLKGSTEKKKASDVDFDALEKQIAALRAQGAGKGEEALAKTVEDLLALEKTYRLQTELKATSMCCVAIVQVRARDPNPPPQATPRETSDPTRLARAWPLLFFSPFCHELGDSRAKIPPGFGGPLVFSRPAKSPA